ncbi:MAG: hypothetical protein Q9218_004380, partial [Villophora microphyllina]
LAGLKRFTYDHNCYLTERGSHYDAPGIIEALRNNAAHSLELLRLEAWRERDLLTFDEDQQYIGSLRMFQSLKSIQLQDLVFRIWEDEDEVSEDNDNLAGEDERRPYSWRNVPYRMDRLEKILPTSVETVHLMQKLEDSDMANLLRGLSGKGKKRVPNLKSLVFEQKLPLTEMLGSYILKLSSTHHLELAFMFSGPFPIHGGPNDTQNWARAVLQKDGPIYLSDTEMEEALEKAATLTWWPSVLAALPFDDFLALKLGDLLGAAVIVMARPHKEWNVHDLEAAIQTLQSRTKLAFKVPSRPPYTSEVNGASAIIKLDIRTTEIDHAGRRA